MNESITMRNKRYTKKQRIFYHIRQGQERRAIQYSKKKELEELGYTVSSNGNISLRGKKINKPKYIWVNFGMKYWLSKEQQNALWAWLLKHNTSKHPHKLISKIIYHILDWHTQVRIVWHEQMNVYRDWSMKILIVMTVDKKEIGYFKIFTNAVEFIAWATKHNIRYVGADMRIWDEFYKNPSLFLTISYLMVKRR